MAKTGKKAGEAPESGAEAPLLSVEALRRFMADSRQSGALARLDALAVSPPQSLLIEGGNVGERLAASLYFALCLNCVQSGGDSPGPCLECPNCLRILGGLHRDLFFLDGRAGSIKIDEVRALRPFLGEAPREARKRAVIFREAQAMGDAAANSLLKSLEEPRPHTVFMLLAPQRERLLPTLVSRSWVLTLPWPHNFDAEEEAVIHWGLALLEFLQSGRGWMSRTSRRESVDADLARRILILCRRALVLSLSGRAKGPQGTPLAVELAALAPARQRMLDEILAECEDSLNYMVNPALVLDWLATRIFLLRARQ